MEIVFLIYSDGSRVYILCCAMKNSCIILAVLLLVFMSNLAQDCGCNKLTQCYQDLQETYGNTPMWDEILCRKFIPVKSNSVLKYLKVLNASCHDRLQLEIPSQTFENRNLYQVTLHGGGVENPEEPILLLDAGQLAGKGSVRLALQLIRQLVACEENRYMTEAVKWIILPNVNPDGLKIRTNGRPYWNKNAKPSSDNSSRGVDISKNFDAAWSSCHLKLSRHAPHYPGTEYFSEIESSFIRDIMNKYLNNIRMYVTVRVGGHSILYPFAHNGQAKHIILSQNMPVMEELARNVSLKVNENDQSIQRFTCMSIFDQNGGNRCGHSVDFGIMKLGIPFALEMRVILSQKGGVMGKFFDLPKDFEQTLLDSYFEGIKVMHSFVSSNT